MIRPLLVADAAAWRTLRLRALKEEPEAFVITHAEESRRGLADTRARFRRHGRERVLLGAFEKGRLVGCVGFWREEYEKIRHKAVIWGMYVEPGQRGRGTGRALMEEALRRIRGLRGVEQVNLAVWAGNGPARALYRSLGFRVIGREPRAAKLGRRYLDDETMVLWLRTS
jgi:ribosomal protein S18 acetylase RimI-like enzyme